VITAADIGQALGGPRHGDGWQVPCPVPGHGKGRGDRNPSLSIDDGDCGLPVVRCHGGCEQEAVLEELKRRGLWEPSANLHKVSRRSDQSRNCDFEKPSRNVDKVSPSIVMPVPTDAPAPNFVSIFRSEPSAFWDYCDSDGRLLGYAVRFDKADGSKDVMPLVYVEGKGWISKAFPQPRPLYGLPRLAEVPSAPVLITEGEKAAVAAAELFDEYVVVTWPGGCNAVALADWTPLKGRNVTIWPDADESGAKAAQAVAAECHKAGAAAVAIVALPDGLPSGWDLANTIPDSMDIAGLISSAPPSVAEATNSRFEPRYWRDLTVTTSPLALIAGLLGEGSMAVLYGEAGDGKTLMAIDMAAHIARGVPWRERNVTDGAIAYIAAEGPHSVERRLIAYKKHHKIEGDVPLALIGASVNLLDPEADLPELIETVERVAADTKQPVRLVVVDTLFRALAGGSDNDATDMGAFVANVDRMREATGAAVLVVHHSGKDKARGARGHSSLRAATDTEIELSRDDASELRTAKVTKQRDGDEGAEFHFKIIGVEIDVVDDGEPIRSAVAEAVEHEGTSKPRLTGQAKLAFEQLQRCIADNGTPAPASNHIPGSCQTVTCNLWRQYLKSAGVTACDTPEAERQAWKRAKDKLLEGKRIGIWNDHVWVAP